jgi:hypothetical protein
MSAEAIFDGYLCEICGQFHAGQYISFACDCPDPYASLSQAKKKYTHFDVNSCLIEDAYYIRGIIELPILELEEQFLWGLWARVWPQDYDEILEHYTDPGKEEITKSFKGRLANRLPGYDSDAFNLKCTIKLQHLGMRPLFVIDEPEHPLAREQRNGISLQRARTIAAIVRHKQ